MAPQLTPRFVIDALSPHISPRRRCRIGRVCRQRLGSVTVLLERPTDPHNVAAVLRSAEAAGLLHVHVVSPDGRVQMSRAVTQGAHKWLDVHWYRTIEEALAVLKRAGFSCWAAVPPPLDHAPSAEGVRPPVDRPAALVLGAERAGLSAEAVSYCAGCFHLPMFGFAQSLNLSVSAALALFDLTSRRRARLGADGDLSEVSQEQLCAGYYARSVRHAPELVWRHLGGSPSSAVARRR